MNDEEPVGEPEQPHRMVRFDFEPGASPKEIAAAIQKARVKLMKEYAESQARQAEAEGEKKG